MNKAAHSRTQSYWHVLKYRVPWSLLSATIKLFYLSVASANWGWSFKLNFCNMLDSDGTYKVHWRTYGATFQVYGLFVAKQAWHGSVVSFLHALDFLKFFLFFFFFFLPRYTIKNYIPYFIPQKNYIPYLLK